MVSIRAGMRPFAGGGEDGQLVVSLEMEEEGERQRGYGLVAGVRVVGTEAIEHVFQVVFDIVVDSQETEHGNVLDPSTTHCSPSFPLHELELADRTYD